MSSDSLPTSLDARSSLPLEHVRVPAAARMILRLLQELQFGALRLRTPDGSVLLYGDGGHPVTLDLHNWRLCAAVLRSGDIGFAETFIAGDWRTDNLPGLIELMVRNRAQIESLIYGNWWGNLMYKVRHVLNRNSRAGSKKNIHAHYDIGNAFYQLWLDPSMTYSSALFSEGASLEQAQAAKYARIAGQLQLQPGQRVLEIGCGWGGFAETAARDHGAHVTGLTLSTEQLAYARQRLHAAGLAAQADLQLCDYRDSHGQYDAIASIEMFEAVGQSYWAGYFDCVARNLKRGGRACIQTIVIADALFERYSKSTDFIQQYIFPGGMLPSPAEFCRAAEAQGLRVVDAFSFGLDYAETLRQWRASFLAQRAALDRQGFDGRFLLTWEFYLAYCEAAFEARNTDVMQFTLIKD
ncbi:cyclopropane-fatty-acyl-phospholipid synthase [Janthinobacterium sp. SUN118]|uniref:SAM-dependent methyltransferase n=1 Tax=Janthinobacterium sp. SUN118 TaxID=3004100 RepID=UPI0025B14B29|nr:cyclopropane-fatty-acyl-phospholipid synthase family protein [Janthinobacterium sp. SUN118]MDN2713012.1 cyclopropane-fatty-acyl-phospholipid synthase [Janthinobacterium sp. SUN118]